MRRKLFALLMMILAIQETAYGGTFRVTPMPEPRLWRRGERFSPPLTLTRVHSTTVPQTRARLVAKKQASANVCSGFIGMATPRTLGVATDHMNTSV